MLVNGFFYGSALIANVSLGQVSTFSGQSTLNLPAVAHNTGLAIAYVTDGAISSLTLNGTSGELATINSATQSFTVEGSTASIWLIQNATGVVQVLPTVSGGTYMSAVVYEIVNDTNNPWTVSGSGQGLVYASDPTKPNALAAPVLNGATHGVTNVYIVVAESVQSGVTVYQPWILDISDGSGAFVHVIGQGIQQAIFGNQQPGQPLASAAVCVNGLVA
jgi:hypothetical protein